MAERSRAEFRPTSKPSDNPSRFQFTRSTVNQFLIVRKLLKREIGRR